MVPEPRIGQAQDGPRTGQDRHAEARTILSRMKATRVKKPGVPQWARRAGLSYTIAWPKLSLVWPPLHIP